jgi:uncharacterized membrane protein YdbT with pleckstrin-like domain
MTRDRQPSSYDGPLASPAVEPEPGEHVFFHGHPSWRSMVGFHVKGVVAAIVAGAVAGIVSAIATGKVEVGWVAASVFVVYALGLARGRLRRLRTTYTISDRRLTIRRGLLARDVEEARLDRIQNVDSRQTMLERLLGVGTVNFDTAGGADYDFSFRGVADPHRIARTVDRALRDPPPTPAGI